MFRFIFEIESKKTCQNCEIILSDGFLGGSVAEGNI